MPNVFEVANGFREERLASERKAATALLNAYGDAWQRIKALLDKLTGEIKQLEDAGGTVSQAWLYRYDRLKTLRSQVEHEIRHFARNADASVTDQQREAVKAAGADTLQLVMTQLGPEAARAAQIEQRWNRVPLEATSNLVGTLQSGPLKALMDTLPLNAGEAVSKALKTGIVLGSGPRKIAQDVKQALGGDLVRALRISRTEVLRSYRSAGIQNYRENSDVIDGWTWMASLSKRTCAMCLAMSGTFHKLSEEFGSHVNCRCTPVPHTRPIEAILGSSEQTALMSRPEVGVPDGKSWFAHQPPAVQEHILGPGKYAAFQEGLITLDDLVGYEDNSKWGPQRFELSLAKALAK